MKNAALLVAAGSVSLASASGCFGDACQAEDASLLQVARNAWDYSSCTKWLDQVIECMKPSTFRVGKELGNVSEFYDSKDEGFEGFYIDDGYDDMFDYGNFIGVSAEGYGFGPALNYTQECSGTWRSAGVGDVEYYTCRVDAQGTGTPDSNASTLWFAGFRSRKGLINGLNVYGELGSDGDGVVKTGDAGCTGKGLCGTYSQTLATYDPSINHLLIVPDSKWNSGNVVPQAARWTESGLPPADADLDYTDLEYESEIFKPSDKSAFKNGGKAVHAAIYVLWGGGGDGTTVAYSQAQFRDAMEIITSKC